MNDQFTPAQISQIQQLIQNETQKKNYFSGSPYIPPHTHDGVNNPQINEANIIPSVAAFGPVEFLENKTYTLNFTASNQTLILFNGIAFQTGAGNDYAIIVGNAVISKAWAFQPQTTSSVITGGTPYPITNKNGKGNIAQSSSNLYIAPGSGGTAFGHVDENYIVNTFSASGVHVVTAQFLNIQIGSVDFVVTNLASEWGLVGNFTIK
jgi:hypothetical protein